MDPRYRRHNFLHMEHLAGRIGPFLMPLSRKRKTDKSKSENRLIYKEKPTGKPSSKVLLADNSWESNPIGNMSLVPGGNYWPFRIMD